ncbi:MAG TPA: flagellar basal body L-ring protein FlgH [Nitrospirales bacterium]|nr:flagellar basal body L-ring protein FlgH [Nitrospirales bacterium]
MTRVMTSRIAAVLLTLLSGCASPEPISSKVVVPAIAPPKTVGSLWQEENGRAYLYEDLRAMRVGDILTIKIVESQKGSKSADTSAERQSTLKATLSGRSVGVPTVSLGGALAGSLNANVSEQNKFGGKGATSRADSLQGTLSAVVVEVMANGDLRIEGQREVTVNSEKQKMRLSGVVRRVDVDTKNTVLSTAIADARIEYAGLGVVDDVQRPGWLVRVLDWIYPF